MAGLPTKRGMKKRKLIQNFPCRRLAIFFLERTVITAILMSCFVLQEEDKPKKKDGETNSE
jgi:hypothetical protein